MGLVWNHTVCILHLRRCSLQGVLCLHIGSGVLCIYLTSVLIMSETALLTTGPAAVYRYQQMAEVLHRKQQQQHDKEEDEEEAQSVDLWLLIDSVTAQLMDPQLAAPAVEFLILEVNVQKALFTRTPLTGCDAWSHKPCLYIASMLWQ